MTGTGRRPVKGQEVQLHCKGWLMKSKKVFWNTREKKGDGHKIKPYKFRVGVGKVIKGWDAGVLSMRLGEKAIIVCTGSYGYGLKGNIKWGIPPNADLEFEMELLHIDAEIKLPDKYDLMKEKMKNKHHFLERDGTSAMLSFRAAPF
uniref:peptidylprolyl isomerase n=1 Tax=Lotharella globosa TaxID=91324 RepID=A0A7S4DLK4_9EUKA